MPFFIATGVIILAIAAATSAVNADSQRLPPMPSTVYDKLPANCGAVAQVTADLPTCAAIAKFAGTTVTNIDQLNPYSTCASPLQVGSAVCIGNTMSFCNNVVIAEKGATCKSIAASTGSSVVNINGMSSTSCKTLKAGDPVCVSDKAKDAAKVKLNGATLSKDMQMMMGANPDFTAILNEGLADASLSEYKGKPSLVIKITKVTAAVKAALPNPGHPGLNAFVLAVKNKESVSLSVTIVPKWFDAGSSGLTYAYIENQGAPTMRRSSGTPPKGRKLLTPHRMQPKKYWKRNVVVYRTTAWASYYYN